MVGRSLAFRDECLQHWQMLTETNPNRESKPARLAVPTLASRAGLPPVKKTGSSEAMDTSPQKMPLRPPASSNTTSSEADKLAKQKKLAKLAKSKKKVKDAAPVAGKEDRPHAVASGGSVDEQDAAVDAVLTSLEGQVNERAPLGLGKEPSTYGPPEVESVPELSKDRRNSLDDTLSSLDSLPNSGSGNGILPMDAVTEAQSQELEDKAQTQEAVPEEEDQELEYETLEEQVKRLFGEEDEEDELYCCGTMEQSLCARDLSLCFLHRDHQPRSFIWELTANIHKPQFDRAVLVLIILSAICMAIERPSIESVSVRLYIIPSIR